MHTLTDEEFSSTALGALEQVFARVCFKTTTTS